MFFILGPLLGWLIQERGYPFALGCFCGLFLVVMLLLNRPLRLQFRGAQTMDYGGGAE